MAITSLNCESPLEALTLTMANMQQSETIPAALKIDGNDRPSQIHDGYGRVIV